jgi:histidinol dehydrogenase
MKIYKHPERSEWKTLLERPVNEAADLEKKLVKILEKVKNKGDKALRKFTEAFDGVRVKELRVTGEEITEAIDSIDEELKQAILLAAKNIKAFHSQQLSQEQKIETMPGVECWRRTVAIERVGLYIPGGSAPLFSTILMLGIPAVIAGCPEIILCSPPGKGGKLHPAILFAAHTVGIGKIFKVGGAQAIAAMAYGTETIPAVYKIFGPGNQYVTFAKQLVQKDGLAIDMPAGPSEVAVLADETADPAFVAADLLSQAEHGPDSQVILVSTSMQVLENCRAETIKQAELLPRKDIALKALENSRFILVNDENECMDLLNEYAPEHLILATANADELASRVLNAGSVFIGSYSPESAGDYASGTNHTLPTNGYAKAYSGVSVDSFVKKISFQKLSAAGLKNIGAAVQLMAEAEGLQAHARAVSLRLEKL